MYNFILVITITYCYSESITVCKSYEGIMARTKGSKNKNSSALPSYATLPTEDRINVLANLIVDKIYEDLGGERAIFKKLEKANDA